MGALYRHFPTREALILEVYRHDINRLVDSVPDVLAAYVRIKYGLGDALAEAVVGERRLPNIWLIAR